MSLIRLAVDAIVPDDDPQTVRALITVEATPPDTTTTTEIPPNVDIVLVIDASGSMHGIPLTQAKSAATTLVGLLGDKDRVAVVRFSHESSILRDLTFLDTAGGGRDLVLNAIDSLYAEGGTNLALGYDTALNLILERTVKNPQRLILFLSDGQDASSFMSRKIVADKASACGVPVYSIGLGHYHDPVALQSISAGGGTFLYADSPAEIVDAFVGALNKTRSCRVRDVQVKVSLDNRPLMLLHAGTETPSFQDTVHLVNFPDIGSGEQRNILVEFPREFPRPDSAAFDSFDVSITYKRIDTDDTITIDSTPISWATPERSEDIAIQRARLVTVAALASMTNADANSHTSIQYARTSLSQATLFVESMSRQCPTSSRTAVAADALASDLRDGLFMLSNTQNVPYTAALRSNLTALASERSVPMASTSRSALYFGHA